MAHQSQPYVTMFEPQDIVVADRLRARLNEDAVNRLVESIRRIGLRTMPCVRKVPQDDGEVMIHVVAGAHRIEACKRLGMQFVDCIVLDETDDQCRLWEIAENLHRAELTAQERAEHIAEWVKLTAEKVAHGEHRLPGGVQPQEKAISKAAKELGLGRMAVSRAVAAESLAPDVMAAATAAGLGIVKRAEVARETTPEAQHEKVREIAERSTVKPAPAIKNAFESEEDWRRSLFNVWNRGAQDWRDRARDTLDGAAVFDSTQAGMVA